MNPTQPGGTSAPPPNPSPAPAPSPLYSATMTSRRSGGMSPLLISTVGLGLGTLIFGIMAMVYYNQAVNTRNTANSRLAAAVANAKTAQKQDDDDAYAQLEATPFRSYIAPVAFGSFEIKFPKSWASYAEEKSSGTQVSLQVNPDFVRKTNGDDEADAARVVLLEQTQAQYMNTYDQLVKQKKLKKSVITVSGIPGFDLTGSFNDKKTIRMVVIPVRDKVIVFTNEDSKYASDFNDILAQSHIVP